MFAGGRGASACRHCGLKPEQYRLPRVLAGHRVSRSAFKDLGEGASSRAREAAIARFRTGELGRGHSQQLRPQRPWPWLRQNQDLAQLIVIQRKRDHRSAKLRAPFLIGYSGRTEVKAAEVLGLYKIQNASRDFFALPICAAFHCTAYAAAPAAWRSSPPTAAPRRTSADLVAERCDEAIRPESGEKRKRAICT